MQNRQMFSGIFEKYNNENLPIKSIHLKDIRTRKGGTVEEDLTFKENEAENIPLQLSAGDCVAFVADLEFKNVKFLEIISI